MNLHANVTDLPEGARIVWSMDGSGFELIPSADGMTCGVKSVSKGSATITAKDNITKFKYRINIPINYRKSKWH